MGKKNTFNVGDIVKLKSGGPEMTIRSVNKHYETKEFSGTYECQWFAGKKLDQGHFPEESLMPVVKESE
ncbi:YodC family protein [Sulfurovum sp.]|uniref:YodC family protein n=1 Tax=Sulfurovum sp. TaxID=1969726 RepID=UPI0035638725